MQTPKRFKSNAEAFLKKAEIFLQHSQKSTIFAQQFERMHKGLIR